MKKVEYDQPTTQNLRILGMNYSLGFIPSEVDFDLHGSADGAICVGKQLLKINSSATRETQRQALFHELVHASDTELSYDSAGAMSEDQVARVSRGLFEILRDNPAIVAWMLAEDA